MPTRIARLIMLSHAVARSRSATVTRAMHGATRHDQFRRQGMLPRAIRQRFRQRPAAGTLHVAGRGAIRISISRVADAHVHDHLCIVSSGSTRRTRTAELALRRLDRIAIRWVRKLASIGHALARWSASPCRTQLEAGRAPPGSATAARSGTRAVAASVSRRVAGPS